MENAFTDLTRSGFLKEVFDFENRSEWQYQGRRPCLITFHDESCPPCKALAPVLTEVAQVYAAQVIFYRVDFERESQLAAELGVKNLPTLVFCPLDDKPVVLQGAASKEKLQQTIEQELLFKTERGTED